MKSIFKVLEFFQGKKTYIVGGLMFVLGVMTNDNQMVLEGLGLITLRAGITNSK